MFNFTPLLGARNTSRASQSILELDGGVKVLIDVGWDERFDTRSLSELEKHVSTLSFILLTHATTSHLGAFAHCCKHIPLFSQIPVYATSPVIAFGRTLIQDLYTSAPLAATFIPATASPEDDTAADDTIRSNILRQPPTFDEINKFFTSITPLKYSQPHQPNASHFSAPLEGLTLTAYNAGHTVGGTIWHIQHGMESIVYAVDWHQAKENVIAGAAWIGGIGGSEVIEQLRKPTALVCSSVNGDKIALTGGVKTRDEALLGHIKSCLSRGGSVLIPTDSSARVLELSWLLEKAWSEGMSEEMTKNARIYMASKSAHATLRHARSLLEWMDESIVREFEGEEETTMRTHRRTGSKQANGASKPSRPFEFKNVKIVERKTQLDRVLKSETSRVIIASDLSVEWGYSRLALEQIAQNPDNLVILTERSDTNDGVSNLSSSTLWQWHQEREYGVALERSLGGDQIEQVHTGGREVVFRDAERSDLDNSEMNKYQQYMATQRQIQDSLATKDAGQIDAADDVIEEDDTSSSESEDSDDEQQGRALNVSSALGHSGRNKVAINDEDLGVSVLLRKKGVYDFDVRNKKGRNAVFPYTHSRRRGDEFGDFIKPEEFLREEEKEAQETEADNQASTVLGMKRKWDESKSDAAHKNKQVKQSRTDGDANDNSDSDDDDSEPDVVVEPEEFRGPAKITFRERVISFQARLAYVDFAGLHDQRSLQLLIPLISPKKLILVGGSVKETDALAADCKELLGMKVVGAADRSVAEIFSPCIGETVDASVDTNAWVVKLTRDLAKRLQWQTVKNIGIVTITGQLKAQAAESSNDNDTGSAKRQKLETDLKSSSGDAKDQSTDYEPVLDAIPASIAAASRSVAQPIHVGDLRLADLRRLMRESGHTADFRGEGTLLVDNMIAVRKLASGKIIVEGSPVNSLQRYDSFAQVKRKIYDGLAVVAAG